MYLHAPIHVAPPLVYAESAHLAAIALCLFEALAPVVHVLSLVGA